MKVRRLSLIFVSATAVFLAAGFAAFRVYVGPIVHPSASATGTTLKIVGLERTDRLSISYTSSGCFHYYTHIFDISGGDFPRAIIIDGGHGWNHGDPVNQNPSPIGVVSLSSGDCRGLDDLLEFYRHPNQGYSSTTTNTITVEYFRGSTKIGQEDFVDESSIEFLLSEKDRSVAKAVDGNPRVTPDMITFAALEKRAHRG